MTGPIHLYSMAYQDRSDRVRWLLEEMGVPYQNHFLKKSSGDLDSESYRALNPMGRVPTIVDGGITLHESAAICLYLADRYAAGCLAPTVEQIDLRAQYLQWMVFSVGSLECVIARMFTHVATPEQKAETHRFVNEQCQIFKKVLLPLLSKQEYILSSGFSAADIMLGAVIPGAQEFLVDGEAPIEAYMQRLMARDAAIRARVF